MFLPFLVNSLSNLGFLDKVKTGKAQAAGSGFGGKGLDRLDKERDAKERAERKAYGEAEEEKPTTVDEAAAVKATASSSDDMTFGSFKVEIRRGPAPDSTKGLYGFGAASVAARRLAFAKDEEKIQRQIKEAEDAGMRGGKDSPTYKQAQSVIAKLNAQLRAARLVLQSQIQLEESGGPKNLKSTSESSDFHAIIPINDYPQKARWRVTNKETMTQVSAYSRHWA